MKVDLIPNSEYGIICPTHGSQGLSRDEYDRQMSMPDSLWKCPIEDCHSPVEWDDDRYEALREPPDEAGTDAWSGGFADNH